MPVFPIFRERKNQVEPCVKGYCRIESDPFFPLEPLDKTGSSGGEQLFQMLVCQFLVQELAEHEKAAALVVAFCCFTTENDMAGLAFWAGERAD